MPHSSRSTQDGNDSGGGGGGGSGGVALAFLSKELRRHKASLRQRLDACRDASRLPWHHPVWPPPSTWSARDLMRFATLQHHERVYQLVVDAHEQEVLLRARAQAVLDEADAFRNAARAAVASGAAEARDVPQGAAQAALTRVRSQFARVAVVEGKIRFMEQVGRASQSSPHPVAYVFGCPVPVPVRLCMHLYSCVACVVCVAGLHLQSKDSQRGLCRVCMVAQVTMVARCGHMLCRPCTVAILKRDPRCPTCRERWPRATMDDFMAVSDHVEREATGPVVHVKGAGQ